MSDVELMIKKGLLKAKDSIVAFTKKLHPNADTSALERAEIRLAIDWSVIQLGLAAAVEFTAHAHYHQWHGRVLHGVKRSHSDDEEDFYSPTSAATSSSHSVISCDISSPVTRSQKLWKL